MKIIQSVEDIFVYLFVGGFFVGILRFLVPALITGTDAVSHLMTYGWTPFIFLAILMLCALAFKKRNRQNK